SNTLNWQVITKFYSERIAKYSFEYAEGTGVMPAGGVAKFACNVGVDLALLEQDRLENYDKRVIWEGKYRTKYLGGSSTTQEVIDAVISNLDSELVYDNLTSLSTPVTFTPKPVLYSPQFRIPLLDFRYIRGKPSLSNLYNCTIPEIINFKNSVVAIVGTKTPEHRIAPLLTYKKISVRDEF
nr:isocitrate dehydrogenase [NAD] regulatory subunit 1, mitochondrial [Tanacetum cinerariifolium]